MISGNHCALLLQNSIYAVSQINRIGCCNREMTHFENTFLDMPSIHFKLSFLCISCHLTKFMIILLAVIYTFLKSLDGENQTDILSINHYVRWVLHLQGHSRLGSWMVEVQFLSEACRIVQVLQATVITFQYHQIF